MITPAGVGADRLPSPPSPAGGRCRTPGRPERLAPDPSRARLMAVTRSGSPGAAAALPLARGAAAAPAALRHRHPDRLHGRDGAAAPAAHGGRVAAVAAPGRARQHAVRGRPARGRAIPASALRARHGTRAVVFLGLALLVAGVVACGLAPGFPAFLLARLVMGIGASAAFLAIFAELLETAPAAWRGRLTNLFEGMAILSLAIGSTLGAWVAGLLGWRWVFVGAGPVLLLCVFAGARARGRGGPPRAGGGAPDRRGVPPRASAPPARVRREPEPVADLVGPLRDDGAPPRPRALRARRRTDRPRAERRLRRGAGRAARGRARHRPDPPRARLLRGRRVGRGWVAWSSRPERIRPSSSSGSS